MDNSSAASLFPRRFPRLIPGLARPAALALLFAAALPAPAQAQDAAELPGPVLETRRHTREEAGQTVEITDTRYALPPARLDISAERVWVRPDPAQPGQAALHMQLRSSSAARLTAIRAEPAGQADLPAPLPLPAGRPITIGPQAQPLTLHGLPPGLNARQPLTLHLTVQGENGLQGELTLEAPVRTPRHRPSPDGNANESATEIRRGTIVQMRRPHSHPQPAAAPTIAEQIRPAPPPEADAAEAADTADTAVPMPPRTRSQPAP